MFNQNIEEIKNTLLNGLYEKFLTSLDIYLPKLIGALVVVGLGFLIAIGIYKLVMYLFNKFKIISFIDNFTFTKAKSAKKEVEKEPLVTHKKISDKIKLDEIAAKAASYYVFLIFFRYSIVIIGIQEVEDFMGELIAYLPSLFIAIVIGFFGVRFANFIYGVVFHALDLTKQKTAKIIASGAKVIVLFFTLMVVLDKVGIASEITNTILIGFVSMLAVAGGLAFGLGGKDIAHEILESFRK